MNDTEIPTNADDFSYPTKNLFSHFLRFYHKGTLITSEVEYFLDR